MSFRSKNLDRLFNVHYLILSVRYKDLSLKFYSLLLAEVDEVQAVSIDEALIDATATIESLKAKYLIEHPESSIADLASHDFAKEYAESLRRQVKEATDCESEFLVRMRQR